MERSFGRITVIAPDTSTVRYTDRSVGSEGTCDACVRRDAISQCHRRAECESLDKP
jgi:hypothetical protein